MFLDWKDVTAQDVQKVLLATKQILSNHNVWIDSGFALNTSKIEVESSDSTAFYFSLMGAIEKNSNQFYPKPLADFVDSATREFLSDLSSYKVWKENMSYDDEIALLRLALDEIKKYV